MRIWFILCSILNMLFKWVRMWFFFRRSSIRAFENITIFSEIKLKFNEIPVQIIKYNANNNVFVQLFCVNMWQKTFFFRERLKVRYLIREPRSFYASFSCERAQIQNVLFFVPYNSSFLLRINKRLFFVIILYEIMAFNSLERSDKKIYKSSRSILKYEHMV